MAYQNGETADYKSPIIRYYMDIRPFAPLTSKGLGPNTPASPSSTLPLLSSLPFETQQSIQRYVRAPDRYMSLASAILKYVFIHRTAKIPWSEVQIGRTPKPHMRPYWKVPTGWQGRDSEGNAFKGVEFNVSHQAGLVLLVGSKTPNHPRDHKIYDDEAEEILQSPVVMNPDPSSLSRGFKETDSEIDEDEDEDRISHAPEVRIGVDVACTWEPPRSPDLSTDERLAEWVDVFAEMFSDRERTDMKEEPVTLDYDALTDDTAVMKQKARRFYTYWALKEAYIKMVGEGLLASWLRELEFVDVVVPDLPGHTDDGSKWIREKDVAGRGLKVLFGGQDVTRTMSVDLEAFEQTFVVATMTRGIQEQAHDGIRWVELDFERDIRPCAEGLCSCLE